MALDGPISIDDARQHMRVDTRSEDENIGRLIRVAARQIETVYGVVSVRREVTFVFDRFTPEVRLPLIPVQPDSITLSYVDPYGEYQPFSDFRAVTRHDWTWISPAVGACWPTPACVPGAIMVTASVGFVDPEAELQEQLRQSPEDLQQAARLVVEHLYRRMPGELPEGVDALVGHYRYLRL